MAWGTRTWRRALRTTLELFNRPVLNSVKMRLSTKLLVVAATAALFSSQAPLGPLALADDTATSASAEYAQAEVKVDDEGCADETCANPEATDEAEDPSCPSRYGSEAWRTRQGGQSGEKFLSASTTRRLGVGNLKFLPSKTHVLPDLTWSLLRVIGSVDAIMKKCDADGDGKITIDGDMEQTKETCLASCF
ncbi:hypothetical protein THAOC_13959, partial [Thalassiosira oceanica]